MRIYLCFFLARQLYTVEGFLICKLKLNIQNLLRIIGHFNNSEEAFHISYNFVESSDVSIYKFTNLVKNIK